MIKPSRSLLTRYTLSLVVVLIAILLRLWLNPYLGRSGFAITLTGMLAAAWIGGLGPCLLGQTILLLTQALWFNPDQSTHSAGTLQGIVSLVAFYSVGAIVALLSEASRKSRKDIREKTIESLEQRERLATILSCMGDGVLVTDASGCITMMNPEAEKLTGWTLAETKKKPIVDVFVIAEKQTLQLIENPVQHVLHHKQVLHENSQIVLTTRSNTFIPISFSAAPIFDCDDNIRGTVLVVRDETERHRTEKALYEADRRKDEFLATLAHELRNPLSPICTGLELLKVSLDEPETIEEVCIVMERQTQHMVRLIDDLLDVSRITRGKLELRKYETVLSDIVRNAVEIVRPAMEEFQHQLIVTLPEVPVLLFADPNRMTQILSNLLDNAAKYTPPQGLIELKGEICGDELLLTVSDNGCGISSEQLETIFEMFMQARSTLERGHQGLGIGLTLVKQLVQMHGGSVKVESQGLNQGSMFQVRLPTMAPKEKQTLPSLSKLNSITTKPLRVLVVDDNADALHSLSSLVKKLGNETFQARDGFEAIEVAQQSNPEVVLMDIGMPNLNGYDAAKRMRKEPWGKQLIIIATTGWGQEEDRRKSEEAGFDGHLVKPINLSRLQEMLIQCVSHRVCEPRFPCRSKPVSNAEDETTNEVLEFSSNGFETN